MTRKGDTLGSLLRRLRRQKNWTLRQMSERTGIPQSTLSKVEQDKLSLTYEKLQLLTARLGLTMAEFLATGDPTAGSAPVVLTARRSLTGDGNSIHVSTPNYQYEYLCTDLREKRIVPILARVTAHDIARFGEPPRHQGEEFVFVLEGAIEVHLQFYMPFVLKAGQGVYLDSTMGHACVAKDCESALVLAACSGEDRSHAVELPGLGLNSTAAGDKSR